MIPDKYLNMSPEDLKKRIAKVKKKLGEELFILSHYYQRDEIVEFADAVGDSYQLAKVGSENGKAKYIVFCGVRFMAEVASVLAKPDQKVFLPDPLAGCPLADLADIEQVESAWVELEKLGIANDLTPVTYINSSAELKSFCGRNGGATCTSSSAKKVLEWGLGKKSKIFFFPDENLGRNTAKSMGISKDEIALWDPQEENGGVSAAELKRAKLILWKGFCHVHTFFTTDHVKDARKRYPGCKVIVHPESNEDVVDISDASGSTAFIKKYVEEAKSGETIIVGTEVSFVSRLARDNPSKRVVPLARSLCANMFRVGLDDLTWTLDEIGKVNEIQVPDLTAKDAKLALDRMLEIQL
ncbi:MAG: quinolinate synthase NadA [Pseudomonadota bacterium]